jgi:competence protein ComEC
MFNPAFSISFAIVAALPITACSGSETSGPITPEPPPVVASVTISPQNAALNGVGDTIRLRAEVKDTRGGVMPVAVTWSASNSATLEVSQQGLVTAKANGTASVTASVGSVSGSASLEVLPRVAPLVVSVLDVAQGDAVWIRNGRTKVLIDGGQSQARMATFIAENNLVGDTIDLMVLTHGHIDHYGGLAEFFKTANNITIREFLENWDATSNVTLLSLRDSVQARETRGQLVVRRADNPCGDGSAVCSRTLEGGARLHVMRPPPEGNTNNRSIPIKVVGPDSASFSMWLSGDAETAAIGYYLAQYQTNPGMRVDVLKGNHHGSCNGFTPEFLAATSPRIATFGVSGTNSFGHVHNQTKDAFRRADIQWLRSDINGRITFTAPGTPNSGFTWTASASLNLSQDGQADRNAAESTCR